MEYHPEKLRPFIRHMSDDQLAKFRELAMKQLGWNQHSPERSRRYLEILDDIDRERGSRYEFHKRDELRNALIRFLQSNCALGESLDRAAARWANAIENAGTSV